MENQENQEKKHKRRVRYSGTHPRNYKEKYKELNPEKYADTISLCVDIRSHLRVPSSCLMSKVNTCF